jgi:hypothetical protein
MADLMARFMADTMAGLSKMIETIACRLIDNIDDIARRLDDKIDARYKQSSDEMNSKYDALEQHVRAQEATDNTKYDALNERLNAQDATIEQQQSQINELTQYMQRSQAAHKSGSARAREQQQAAVATVAREQQQAAQSQAASVAEHAQKKRTGSTRERPARSNQQTTRSQQQTTHKPVVAVPDMQMAAYLQQQQAAVAPVQQQAAFEPVAEKVSVDSERGGVFCSELMNFFRFTTLNAERSATFDDIVKGVNDRVDEKFEDWQVKDLLKEMDDQNKVMICKHSGGTIEGGTGIILID